MALLKNGSKGAKVKELQLLLSKIGYSITVDGIFGNQSEEAVIDFQTKNDLFVDGVVGPKTLKIMKAKVDGLMKVKGEKLTEKDIINVAKMLDVEIAAIKAVYEVESRGSGFLEDKRPKVLFEGHIFWRQLRALGIDPLEHVIGNEDILFRKWTRNHYKGGVREYDRLNRAKEIHEAAALASASWGTFQIMGFNYKACGFSSVISYVEAQHISEGEHLKAFGSFIQSANLVRHLKRKNWGRFAQGYNGPGYKKNRYDWKLAVAYAKYKN